MTKGSLRSLCRVHPVTTKDKSRIDGISQATFHLPFFTSFPWFFLFFSFSSFLDSVFVFFWLSFWRWGFFFFCLFFFFSVFFFCKASCVLLFGSIGVFLGVGSCIHYAFVSIFFLRFFSFPTRIAHWISSKNLHPCNFYFAFFIPKCFFKCQLFIIIFFSHLF